MTDTGSRSHLKASRDPLERLPDEVFIRPLHSLSQAERAMVKRANTDHPDEFMERIRSIRRAKERQS